MAGGLHAYLAEITRQCAEIHGAIYQTYITYPIEASLSCLNGPDELLQLRHVTRFSYHAPITESVMEVRMQPHQRGRAALPRVSS